VKKKYLILKSNKDDFEKFYLEHMQAENVTTMPIYKYNRGILWDIIVIWIEKLCLPFQSVWYSCWKNTVQSYDVIIIFDRNLNWNLIPYIRKRNPMIRIIVWYWNIVHEKNLLPDKYRKYCEVWSFDKQDCIQYGMRQNSQFYFDNLGIEIKKKKFDAVFVGRDKGRACKVLKIKEVLEQCGYSVFLNIVKDRTSVEADNKLEYNKMIDYKQVLEKISESNCIIDIPQKGQSGLTARVLEALYLRKKLITTDETILEYNFYKAQNILFWNGRCSDEEIKKFLDTPYESLDREFLKQYTFSEWLERFEL